MVDPIRLDPFQQIINVSWPIAGNFIAIDFNTTSFFLVPPDTWDGAQSNVTVGPGINQFTLTALNGILDETAGQFEPAYDAINHPFDQAITDLTADIASFPTFYRNTGVVRPVTNNCEVNNLLLGSALDTIFFNVAKLKLLFGDTAMFTISHNVPEGFNTIPMWFFFNGTIGTYAALQEMNRTVNDDFPYYESVAVVGTGVDYYEMRFAQAPAGGPGLKSPQGSFIFEVDLNTLAITDLTVY